MVTMTCHPSLTVVCAHVSAHPPGWAVLIVPVLVLLVAVLPAFVIGGKR